MPTLTMPQLGESVTEGTILRWLKQPGEAVALDEPLVEVETEKVTVEIPSPWMGTLSAVLVREGETVAVGTPIAEIAAGGTAAGTPPTERPTPAAAPPAAAVGPAVPEPRPETRAAEATAHPAAGEARFSPAVRRLASEHGIDPGSIRGSGAGGRVTRWDLERAVAERSGGGAAAAPAAAAADEVVTFSPTRRRIAAHMAESRRTAAHAWLAVEAAVPGLVALREAEKAGFREREGVDLTYLAFAAHAVCGALRAFPLLNATWDGEQLIRRGAVNLSIAVDTEEGLVAPVIPHADRLSITGLARAIAELSERARARRLRLADVQSGTFTLDNTGALGTVLSAPIINSPQVAILTTEAIRRQAVVVGEDAIAVRPVMNLCLSFDHRAMDGSAAARFAAAVRAALEAFGPGSPIG